MTIEWYNSFTSTVLIIISLYIANLLFRAQAEAQDRSDDRLRNLTIWQANFTIRYEHLSKAMVKSEDLRLQIAIAPDLTNGSDSFHTWQFHVMPSVQEFIKEWKNTCRVLAISYSIDDLLETLYVSNIMKTVKHEDLELGEYQKNLRTISKELESITEAAKILLRQSP